MDIDVSFQFSNKINLNEYDEEAKPKNLGDEMANINVLDLITIGEHNKAYKLWKGFVVLNSLVSSYFYAYMSAFYSPKPENNLFKVMLFFEIVFFAQIILKFFEEFTKDGQTIPTKDLGEIARKYLKDQFIYDLIPLIPFPYLLPLGGKEGHLYFIKVIRLVNGF